MEGLRLQRILSAAVIICSLAVNCHGETAVKRPFSLLQNNLVVAATSKKGELMAGEDTITVTWGPNQNTSATVAAAYKTVKVKLCYTKISQTDRPWRKTNHVNIAKDKTCQFVMFAGPYEHKSDVKTYLITKEIPGAIYFIRAYAFDANKLEVAYGQTADGITFDVVGITGRGTSIDLAAGVFSAFSVLSLGYFFYMEKRKSKMGVDF